VRLGQRFDHGRLAHHLAVDAQPSGGVDDDDVVELLLGVLDRVLGNHDRIAHSVARLRGEASHLRPFGNHLQLLNCVGTLQVGGDQHRGMALFLQPGAKLARECGLAGALKASEHDDGGGLLGEPDQPGLAAEYLD